ncbi:hypothetical protein FB451DRAFT_973509, partial [Mycena latifolia]
IVSVSMATVALEGLLYGVFLVLFFTIMYLRAKRYSAAPHLSQSCRAILNPIALSAAAMCGTITAHWILTVDRFFLAFLYFKNGAAPLLLYADLSHPTEIAKTGIIVGDAVIIYRVWLIWNRNNRIVVFPILCWCAFFVCTIGVTYQFSRYNLGDNVFLMSSGRWITSNWVFIVTLALPGLSHAPMSAHNFWTVYVPYLFFAISYEHGSNLQFFAIDLAPAVVGIANMLIQVRVGLGWSNQGRKGSSTAPTSMLFEARDHRAG